MLYLTQTPEASRIACYEWFRPSVFSASISGHSSFTLKFPAPFRSNNVCLTFTLLTLLWQSQTHFLLKKLFSLYYLWKSNMNVIGTQSMQETPGDFIRKRQLRTPLPFSLISNDVKFWPNLYFQGSRSTEEMQFTLWSKDLPLLLLHYFWHYLSSASVRKSGFNSQGNHLSH